MKNGFMREYFWFVLEKTLPVFFKWKS